MASEPNYVSTGKGFFRSILGIIMPNHLLGRLYLLFAIVAIEYLYCFMGRGANPNLPIPGHLRFFGMETDAYGQIPIFAFIVFLGFGHSRLKAQQDKIPFGRLIFIGHLLCMAAVVSFTLAEWKGSAWHLFDTYSYTKSAFYVLGTVLLAVALIPPRSWLVLIHTTGRLWLYASLAGVG